MASHDTHSGPAGATAFYGPSPKHPSDASPQTPSQPTQEHPKKAQKADKANKNPRPPKQPGRIKRRRTLVQQSYAAREKQLEGLRGAAVMPAHDTWDQNLKLRMIAYWLVRFVVFVLMCTFLCRRQKVPFTFVPRPGLWERAQIATNTTQNVEFHETKVVSFFTLKGGIGKTTLAKLAALMMRKICNYLQIVVQDCNRDRGNLGDRGARTSKFSIVDVIENLKHIERLPDLMRYCTRTAEGLLILASTRPKQRLVGTIHLSKEGLQQLHARERQLVNMVYNDLGTSTESEATQAALDETDQLVLPTTPSRDSLEQLGQTLSDLLTNNNGKHAELARHAIIVVNKWRWLWRFFTTPEKIRQQFQQEFEDDFKDVTILTVNSGLFMLLGLHITPGLVSRRMRIQAMELNAAIATRLADGYVDDEASQLTHKEQLAREAAIVQRPTLASCPRHPIPPYVSTSLEDWQPVSASTQDSGVSPPNPSV